MEILNEHYTVLAWLDTKARQLGKDAQRLNQEIGSANLGH